MDSDTRKVVLPSLGCWLEIQIPGPHPLPAESETLGVSLEIWALTISPGDYDAYLGFSSVLMVLWFSPGHICNIL